MAARSRVNTYASDSGCSDISVVSTGSSFSSSSRSTLKRKCVERADGIGSRKNSRSSPSGVSTDSEEIETFVVGEWTGALEIEDDIPYTSPRSLWKEYPSRKDGYELVILRQPESYHRARYQKEGSRGCIKDASGNTCPAIQIVGITQPAMLQIFVANDSGPALPHVAYHACKVGGKQNKTPVKALEMGTTRVLEIEALPEADGVVNVDFMAIMKMRNVDLDTLVPGVRYPSKSKSRLQSKVRIVFRAVIHQPNSNVVVLQEASTPICCVASPGVPEVHRLSHTDIPASGGMEVVVLGRNFDKNDTQAFIAEMDADQNKVLWEKEISVSREHFHQVHLVTVIPPYPEPLYAPVEIQMIVRNKNKVSEPYTFRYVPEQNCRSKCNRNLSSERPTQCEKEITYCTSTTSPAATCNSSFYLPGNNGAPVIMSIPVTEQYPLSSVQNFQDVQNVLNTLNTLFDPVSPPEQDPNQAPFASAELDSKWEEIMQTLFEGTDPQSLQNLQNMVSL